VSKLTDADGEQLETQHWTIEALDANYLNQEQFDSLIGLCEEIGRMLNSMIRKSESFSGDEDALREDASIYGDGDEPCSN
jgi:hypothetical protein